MNGGETSKEAVIIGAGISGLTCGVLFAERGWRTTIFARETGSQTTSAAAAAIWFPYDAEPAEKVIEWALATFAVFRDLAADQSSGVSLIELRVCAREGACAIPEWARPLGARAFAPAQDDIFASGYAVEVPLIDTSVYLDYLSGRFAGLGGALVGNMDVPHPAAVENRQALIVNCTGIGAKLFVPDAGVEPHRGQVVITPKVPLPYAIVCNDPPLMYAIPRRNDCVLGGTNTVSDELAPSADDTAQIVAEYARTMRNAAPTVRATRVGLRPFRRAGVRLAREQLPDGRTVIHNYGHGGAGFTLSWGCAEAVAQLAGLGSRG